VRPPEQAQEEVAEVRIDKSNDQRRADRLCDRVTGAAGSKAVSRCKECGRPLRDAESKERGVGPACAEKRKHK
jgi:hypothetical protein